MPIPKLMHHTQQAHTIALARLNRMAESVSQIESGSHATFPFIRCHHCSLVQAALLNGICPGLHLL